MKIFEKKMLIKLLIIYWFLLLLANHFFYVFQHLGRDEETKKVMTIIEWENIFNWAIVIPGAIFIIIKIFKWGDKK